MNYDLSVRTLRALDKVMTPYEELLQAEFWPVIMRIEDDAISIMSSITLSTIQY